MWKPPVNFITLHYAFIISLGILGLAILYPYGNLSAIDAYFFGVSGSTESGLNTVDVKDLKTYQQLFLYFVPVIANFGFVNIIVVLVRLFWFEKQLRCIAPKLRNAGSHRETGNPEDLEAQRIERRGETFGVEDSAVPDKGEQGDIPGLSIQENFVSSNSNRDEEKDFPISPQERISDNPPSTHVTFAPDAKRPQNGNTTLVIPSPRERERGKPMVELDDELLSNHDDEFAKTDDADVRPSGSTRRRGHGRLGMSTALSIERVASSMFVVGATPSNEVKPRHKPDVSPSRDMLFLSSQATVGRNSQFHNLTARDRELLGGIEYRALKILLKIVVGLFFGLHVIGAICLVGWIQYANPKYTEYLKECGQDKIWWAFYSAQTMVDNLGFTLTPDSMITFRDATFPMLIMSFLAFAGNTFYPCLLRLIIWTMYKLAPSESSVKEPLQFLLQHPRRCFTLLFPSRPTWILFGILLALNILDVVLIIVLDLNNPEVTALPAGPRVLAAIFQAASSRHTGTATFNLALVNPAVQFSLLTMMYISAFPIAMSVRASNTYEEKSLGLYYQESEIDESKGASYVLMHMRNQLSFDLWFIFLGVFCICITESERIMDNSDPAIAVFPIFFEVVSAYGNVGLSLGHPTVLTSLSGQFKTFSKLVICALMIRGRHRWLPYQLDRAIVLPNKEHIIENLTSEVPLQEDSGTTRTKGKFRLPISQAAS